MLAQAAFDLPFSFHWGCGYHLKQTNKQTNKQTKTTCSYGRPGYKLEVCVIIILLQIFSEIFLLNCWHMPQYMLNDSYIGTDRFSKHADKN